MSATDSYSSPSTAQLYRNVCLWICNWSVTSNTTERIYDHKQAFQSWHSCCMQVLTCRRVEGFRWKETVSTQANTSKPILDIKLCQCWLNRHNELFSVKIPLHLGFIGNTFFNKRVVLCCRLLVINTCEYETQCYKL